ncbi:uncharacterized protein [Blastocystis hominis]|uniref:Treble clef zinc finger domain-containing protein n=1 Tax=Blastocystis hominis TaxID=12968 RepID=D8LYM4_BLAHO|nr:uncharacterized protein [Blastocystis hominis]CBK20679.2 unnamed protein product [Blastocystis hominis]|eukprot:XP_012894727.1 uncharacterized protein [Blastocystis hominis]
MLQRLSTRSTLLIELMNEWVTHQKPTGALGLLLEPLVVYYAEGKTRSCKTNRPTLKMMLADREDSKQPWEMSPILEATTLVTATQLYDRYILTVIFLTIPSAVFENRRRFAQIVQALFCPEPNHGHANDPKLSVIISSATTSSESSSALYPSLCSSLSSLPIFHCNKTKTYFRIIVFYVVCCTEVFPYHREALTCQLCVIQRVVRFYSQRSKCPPISQTSPELLHYWHPTKNINITPDDVSIKSFDKVWWKCPKGVDHEWECSVRYALKSDGKTVNCPFCFNKRVSITNSLATRYPEIAAQWHPTKNGSLLPSQVTYVSNTAVWWQCDRDPSHVWKREIRKRVHPLTASQDVAFPEIAKEWDYERNGELVPSDVSKSSSAVVWWKCSKGHEWRTSVNNRTSSHHSGCPICKGHEISLERSLAYQYPELAVQWHPTKNLPLLPSTVFPYSNRSVWWVCNLNRPSNDSSEETVQFGNFSPSANVCVGCGQEWQESIKNRVSKYKGSHNLLCPTCSTKNRKQTVNSRSSPKKPSESKKLRKIRIVGGNDNQEVIMVSASDYENLIALGSQW